MSVISTAPAAPQGTARRSSAAGLLATAQRWWASYVNRRIKRAAIDALWSMSDRELQDIGLTRGQIVNAVRAGLARDRSR